MGFSRGWGPQRRTTVPKNVTTSYASNLSKGLGSQAEGTCCKSEGVGIRVQPRCGEPGVPGNSAQSSQEGPETSEKVSHKSGEYVRKNRLEGKRMNGPHELSLG